MRAINIILLGIVMIYGSLTILTCMVQLKRKEIKMWSNILMFMGSASIITVMILSVTQRHNLILYLCSGLVLIHISAVNNGLHLNKKLNPRHHMIRMVLSILIVTLYAMGS